MRIIPLAAAEHAGRPHLVTTPTVPRPAPSVVDTGPLDLGQGRICPREDANPGGDYPARVPAGRVGFVDVAIVSLLSVILAALLAMPWWIFRMMDSLRKELTSKIEESDAKTDAKFANLETKLTNLETKTDAKLADLEAKLTARIDRLEAGTDAKFANLETKLTSKIDGLRREVTKLSERVARIEGYLFGIEPPAPDDPTPGDGTGRPEPPVA